MRGTGMPAPLPGNGNPAVSAATPPRPDGERPPQLPVRAKAALTFFQSRAVFRVAYPEGDMHLRFLGVAHGNSVVGARIC